jgi:hypothetical protein
MFIATGFLVSQLKNTMNAPVSLPVSERYKRKSLPLRSIKPGNESDISVNEPVPLRPTLFPSQPGPSITFMLKKNVMAAAIA